MFEKKEKANKKFISITLFVDLSIEIMCTYRIIVWFFYESDKIGDKNKVIERPPLTLFYPL